MYKIQLNAEGNDAFNKKTITIPGDSIASDGNFFYFHDEEPRSLTFVIRASYVNAIERAENGQSEKVSLNTDRLASKS